MEKIEYNVKDQVNKLIDLMDNNDKFIVETGEKGMYNLILALENSDIKLHFDIEYTNALDIPLYYKIVKTENNTKKTIGKIYMNAEQDDRNKNKVIHSEGGVTGSYEYYFYTLNNKLPSVEFKS